MWSAKLGRVYTLVLYVPVNGLPQGGAIRELNLQALNLAFLL